VGSSLYSEWVRSGTCEIWFIYNYYYYHIILYCVRTTRLYVYTLYIILFSLLNEKTFRKNVLFFFLYQVPTSCTFPICMCHSRFDVFSFRVYSPYLSTRTPTEGGDNSKFLKVIYSPFDPWAIINVFLFLHEHCFLFVLNYDTCYWTSHERRALLSGAIALFFLK